MSYTQAPTTRESRHLGTALLRALNIQDEPPIVPSNTPNPLEPSNNNDHALETETPSLTDLYNELWAQYSWLGAGYNGLLTENSNQHNRNQALAAENRRLALLLTDHRAKSQYFEDENAKLKRNFDIMVLHVRDFQESVADLRSENASLKDARPRELFELRTEVANQTAFNLTLHEAYGKLEREIDAARLERGALRDEHAGFREKVSTQMAELRAKNAELVSDNAHVESVDEIHRDAYDTLKKVYSQQKREMQKLRDQARVDEDAIFALREEVARQRDSIERVALREGPEERSRLEEQWARATTAVAEGQVQVDDAIAISDPAARNLHLEIEHLKTVVSAHVEKIANLETQRTALMNDPYRWARRDEVYEALRLENRVQVERYMGIQAELDSQEGCVAGVVMQEVRNDRLEARDRSHRNQIRRLEGELARLEGSYEDDEYESVS